MMAKSHIITSIAAYVGISALTNNAVPIEGTPLAAFGALLPDMDHPGSKVGRKFRFLLFPYILYYTVGHRTLTHSIFAIIGMGWLTWFLTLSHPSIFAAITIGYTLHVLEDMMTVGGVPIFWPFSQTKYHIPFFSIKTNGIAEWSISSLCLVWLLYYASQSLPHFIDNLQY